MRFSVQCKILMDPVAVCLAYSEASNSILIKNHKMHKLLWILPLSPVSPSFASCAGRPAVRPSDRPSLALALAVALAVALVWGVASATNLAQAQGCGSARVCGRG